MAASIQIMKLFLLCPSIVKIWMIHKIKTPPHKGEKKQKEEQKSQLQEKSQTDIDLLT